MKVPFGTPYYSFSPSFSIYFLAENAVTIEFGEEIDNEIFERVHQFNELLNQRPFEGFMCTVPAYASLTVFYDIMSVMKASQLAGINGFERVSHYLVQLLQQATSSVGYTPKPVRLPICYEGDLAPDLNYVASYHNISPDEVINLHSTATYKVYMIGFVPGFAYLGGMNPTLETPRKKVPRKQVASGSVGIAGKQTGIYPLQIPGGWQIIGCCPIPLFDIKRTPSSLLRAGDKVVFDVINLKEFKALKKAANST